MKMIQRLFEGYLFFEVTCLGASDHLAFPPLAPLANNHNQPKLKMARIYTHQMHQLLFPTAILCNLSFQWHCILLSVQLSVLIGKRSVVRPNLNIMSNSQHHVNNTNAAKLYFLAFLLLKTSNGFQSINGQSSFILRGTRKDDRPYRTNLAAVKDGGMDAFTAQLQAALAEADIESSSDGVNNSDTPSDFHYTPPDPLQPPTPSHRTGKHSISNLLMQRAIQTQLYYLADLRDEPTYMWLREFLDQGHLDDKGRFNELDGLRCQGGWTSYLKQLENAPSFSITVQLAPPRLSAQQQRNPYLAAQAAVGRSYEETVLPTKISQTLRTVARSLETEWVTVLSQMAEEDRKRLQIYNAVPQIHTADAAYQEYWRERQVVAGGEGDDQGTPLHSLNERIVTRFCTRVALDDLIRELLQEESIADGDYNDDESAKRAAVEWLSNFANEWEPKLQRGPNDDQRRSLGIPPPGHYQRLCANGADANDVTEAMWQELPPLFAYTSDDAMRLYSPEALVMRLRRVRADVCDELIGDLRSTVFAMSSTNADV